MAVSNKSQKQAQQTRTIVQKAVKALILIVAGVTALFLLKLFKLLKRKSKGEDVDSQIAQLKDQWESRMESVLKDSWTKGVKLGLQAAALQGKKSSGSTVINDDILTSLLSDVRKTIDDAEAMLSKGIEDDNIDLARKAVTLRMQMTAEAGLKFALAETIESKLASPNTQKMWIATSKVPCSHCARLHGMVRDWGEEFPHEFNGIYKLKVYGGILTSPPRHPNCRCVLIAVPKEK